MDVDDFAERFPVLWRLGMAGSSEGIRRHGLLTAAQIAARAGIALPATPRPAALRGALEDGTPVAVTDNSPLSFAKLAPVLDDGLAPEDWLAMLDDRAFFWPRRALGAGNLRARRRLGYASEWQGYETRALLGPVWDRAEVAPINTGATLRRPTRRGRATFAGLAGLDWDAWRRARRAAGVVTGLDDAKEVTVRGGVPRAGEALRVVEAA